MSASSDRWKLGLFVVAGLFVLLGGLTFAGMAQLQRPCHAAFAFFDEPVVGLEPGSSVRFRGVPIGVVDDITLASDKKHLQVRMALYDDKLAKLGLDPEQLGPDQPFPADLRAQLVTQYITQMSFVLVDFQSPNGGPERDLPFGVPANTIRSVPSAFRSFEEGVREVLREVPAIATAGRELLAAISDDVKAARLPELGRQLERTLAAVEDRLVRLEELPAMTQATSAFAEVSALAKELRQDDGPLVNGLGELRALAQDLRQELAKAEVGATSAGLRDAAKGAALMAEDVGALAQGLRAELEQVRAALSALERLAMLLERDPGALLHGRSPSSSPLRKE